MKLPVAFLLLISVGSVVVGCQSAEPDSPAAPDASSTTSSSESGPGGGTPISPAAGGLSPVTDSDVVTGAGGGGIQQSMKNKARETATQAPSSVNQMPPDDGN